MDSFYEFVLKCYPEPINNGDQEAYEAAMEQHTAILAECDRQLLEFRRGDGIWGRPAVQLNAKLVSAVGYVRQAALAARCAAGAGSLIWRSTG